ncbi:MAG: hypothetical protein P4L42_08375 [Desulfocapsaceae bacterium]|nr:hypothetical protein [Desulfocapsaceae bacterium]
MKKTTLYRALALTLPFLAVLLCREAFALQTHGGGEGMVVHQLAHIQYFGALGYLLWDIRRSAFVGVGWRYLQKFCLLLMIWNAVAFIGHFSQLFLAQEAIDTSDGYLYALLQAPITVGKLIFYITALDHLVCAPALFFLFLAMRSFYRSTDETEDR